MAALRYTAPKETFCPVPFLYQTPQGYTRFRSLPPPLPKNNSRPSTWLIVTSWRCYEFVYKVPRYPLCHYFRRQNSHAKNALPRNLLYGGHITTQTKGSIINATVPTSTLNFLGLSYILCAAYIYTSLQLRCCRLAFVGVYVACVRSKSLCRRPASLLLLSFGGVNHRNLINNRIQTLPLGMFTGFTNLQTL